MALSINFNRPLTAQTAQESTSQAAALTEGASFWYVDITATVNSEVRLLGRFKITPKIVGPIQSYEVRFLDFSSTADAAFTAGQTTTPFTEAEADANYLISANTPGTNMHTLFVTAGDTTPS